jgi:hypothetical protein
MQNSFIQASRRSLLSQTIGLFCAISLSANLSCVHTLSKESQVVNANEVEKPLDAASVVGPFKLQSLVYTESKLPLEEFFRRLTAGEFKKAFTSLDLRYRASNTDNKIMRELISDGFVPAYVRVQNISDKTQEISEKQFSITNGPIRAQAIQAEHIPREFKRINGKALAANVLNVGTVVVGMAALVGVLVLLKPSQFEPSAGSGAGVGSDSNTKVFNQTHLTTEIDYRDLVIRKKTLAPGEMAEGLLIFLNFSREPIQEFRLELNLPH